MQGSPIAHNGQLFEDVLARAKMTHHELNAALRQAGCSCLEDVKSVILENNGSISVVPRRTRMTILMRERSPLRHHGLSAQQWAGPGRELADVGQWPKKANSFKMPSPSRKAKGGCCGINSRYLGNSLYCPGHREAIALCVKGRRFARTSRPRDWNRLWESGS